MASQQKAYLKFVDVFLLTVNRMFLMTSFLTIGCGNRGKICELLALCTDLSKHARSCEIRVDLLVL